MNWKNYKFRPSQLDCLMTASRKKGELSETTKSVLQEIWIKETYKKEKIITSKFMEKGISKENESISLYRQFSQQFCKKNEEKLENDYFVGTPDLIFSNKVVDIKTSWDIWTFAKVNYKDASKNYQYQLLAYMSLTGKSQSQLAYCLVDNSDFIIYSEVKKLVWSLGLDEQKNQDVITKLEDQIIRNNTYSDIPLADRVKIFDFEFSQKNLETIYTQLDLCRNYLINFKL